jgi:hypothetical protein
MGFNAGSGRPYMVIHDVHGAGVSTIRAGFAASVVLSCAVCDCSQPAERLWADETIYRSLLWNTRGRPAW